MHPLFLSLHPSPGQNSTLSFRFPPSLSQSCSLSPLLSQSHFQLLSSPIPFFLHFRVNLPLPHFIFLSPSSISSFRFRQLHYSHSLSSILLFLKIGTRSFSLPHVFSFYLPSPYLSRDLILPLSSLLSLNLISHLCKSFLPQFRPQPSLHLPREKSFLLPPLLSCSRRLSPDQSILIPLFISTFSLIFYILSISLSIF